MMAAFLLAADLAAATPHVTICQPHKPVDAREYWSWRLIENRMCWYPGRPGRSKDLLRWSPASKGGEEPRPVVVPPQVRDSPVPPPEPGPEPTTIIKPEPQLGAFEQRWRDLMIDLMTPPQGRSMGQWPEDWRK